MAAEQIIDGASGSVQTLTGTENIAIAALVVFIAVLLGMVIVLWRHSVKTNEKYHSLGMKTLEAWSEMKSIILASITRD